MNTLTFRIGEIYIGDIIEWEYWCPTRVNGSWSHRPHVVEARVFRVEKGWTDKEVIVTITFEHPVKEDVIVMITEAMDRYTESTFCLITMRELLDIYER